MRVVGLTVHLVELAPSRSGFEVSVKKSPIFHWKIKFT
jgi:hypothetical protein